MSDIDMIHRSDLHDNRIFMRVLHNYCYRSREEPEIPFTGKIERENKVVLCIASYGLYLIKTKGDFT